MNVGQETTFQIDERTKFQEIKKLEVENSELENSESETENGIGVQLNAT